MLVEVARAESERGEVVLRRRTTDAAADVLELRVNGVFVMDSQETATERALAAQALACVPDPRNVIVAGLGLGYTLREVLADVRVERVMVVEIEEALVAWARDGTLPGGPELLADRRVGIVNADIVTAVAEAATKDTYGHYDLVLLDVDNGPGYLVHQDNESIYRASFLGRLRSIVSSGGAVAIWSADESPALADALIEVYGNCERIGVPVQLQERETEYLLYLARR